MPLLRLGLCKDSDNSSWLTSEAERWRVLMADENEAARHLAEFDKWLGCAKNMQAFEAAIHRHNAQLHKNKAKSWTRILKPIPMTVASLLGLAILFVGPMSDGPHHEIQVPVGQWHDYSLTDGSVINFGPGAKGQMRHSTQSRDITLDEGAVIVTAAKNPNSPLNVRTPHGDVLVIGTKFIVHADALSTEVTVLEGKVMASSNVTKDMGQFVTPLQRIRITDQGVVQIDDKVESADEILKGWRSLRSATIQDAAKTISTHSGRIILVSPLLKERITGRLNLNDPESSLRLVAAANNTQMQNLPFGVTLLY